MRKGKLFHNKIFAKCIDSPDICFANYPGPSTDGTWEYLQKKYSKFLLIVQINSLSKYHKEDIYRAKDIKKIATFRIKRKKVIRGKDRQTDGHFLILLF